MKFQWNIHCKYICIFSFSSCMEISPSRSTLSEGEKGTKRFYWFKQGSSSSRSHNSSGTFSVPSDSWHEKKRLWQWEDITKGQTDTAYNGIWNSYKVSWLNQDLRGIFMILMWNCNLPFWTIHYLVFSPKVVLIIFFLFSGQAFNSSLWSSGTQISGPLVRGKT